MNDFYYRTGLIAISRRLRHLADTLCKDDHEINELYNVDMEPRWFPVFFSLLGTDGKSITEIAREVEVRHPNVIAIAKDMEAAGLVILKSDTEDKRRTLAQLTPKARNLEPALEQQWRDMERALNKINLATGIDLWEALNLWEAQIGERSILKRVEKEKKDAKKDGLQIVDYDEKKHHDAFRKLNEKWISDLFDITADDIHDIDHPYENIIEPGGYIYIAEYNGIPVGSFALMPCLQQQYDWELVKFAVDPGIRGVGIGKRLIETILTKARHIGGYRLYIESNSRCGAALHLLEKYGFKYLQGPSRQPDRYDVRLALQMNNSL